MEELPDKVLGIGAISASTSEPAECLEGDATVAEEDTDEMTGASPGTAQACCDLGLNSLAVNLERLGLKPPGQ